MPSRLLGTAATLLTLALCLNLPPSSAQTPLQTKPRSVEKLKFPKEPVKIAGAKNWRKHFRIGEEFADDDEWVDGFAVTILNTSSKTITSLRVDLTFVRPPGHASSDDPPLNYPLQFNPSPFQPEYTLRDRARVVRPGETIELRLSEEEYAGVRRFLQQLNYPRSFHRVQVSINTVGFDDGTVWSAGTEFHPDTHDPGRLVPEEEPRGRAHHRSAVFLWLRRASYDATVMRVRAGAARPAPTNAQVYNPCGRKVFSPRDWCTQSDPPLTCSVEYDDIDTNSLIKTVQAKPKVEPCLRWDTSRNVWIQCGSIRVVPRAVPCTQPPPGAGCVAAGLDGGCPDGTYPDGYGMCCSGSCGVAASAPDSASLDAYGDGPSPNLAAGGGGGDGCACDDAQRLQCYNSGGDWDDLSCSCVSPILLDLEGDGFALTDGAGGVDFDFTGAGALKRMAWTAAGSDDAWLALDRNGNGRVDDGRELFGTSTPQPAAGAERNGFRALEVYDLPGNGGNSDGVIDARDAVFPSLRLWRDANHDGVSEPWELRGLAEAGVAGVGLDYKESRRTDEHGNRFRFRAKVEDARGQRVGRWAWDVFPVRPL